MESQGQNSSLELLQKYTQTLEKENHAKNVQTALLYERLNQLTDENKNAKKELQSVRLLYQGSVQDQLRYLENIQMLKRQNDELESKLDDIELQIQNFQQISDLKNENEQIKQELIEKYKQIQEKDEQNSQLCTVVSELEKEVVSMRQKLQEAQEKKNKYAKKAKQLEETNYQLKEALEQTKINSQNSYIRVDFDKLVKDNNQLIQKVRFLQKQKNIYYNELKSISPLRQGRSTIRQQQRRKTMNQKNEHWSQMQDKINNLKNENEQLKANLIIR